QQRRPVTCIHCHLAPPHAVAEQHHPLLHAQLQCHVQHLQHAVRLIRSGRFHVGSFRESRQSTLGPIRPEHIASTINPRRLALAGAVAGCPTTPPRRSPGSRARPPHRARSASPPPSALWRCSRPAPRRSRSPPPPTSPRRRSAAASAPSAAGSSRPAVPGCFAAA